ncbi:MAG: PTS sugar transporter subunit IIA [Anaerolineae bacterium]
MKNLWLLPWIDHHPIVADNQGYRYQGVADRGHRDRSAEIVLSAPHSLNEAAPYGGSRKPGQILGIDQMSETEDFDLASLASYLHLTPQQVQRLAERGKIPGRKVAGQWRFSRAEIHHWLERRIGLATEDEDLAEMEHQLRSKASPGSDISIAEMLPPEAIEVPLAAKTRIAVIRRMTEVAARTGWLWDPEAMAEAVLAREEMHPTALENGVALLHPRRPLSRILGQPFLAFGRTASGIPFGSESGTLTDCFFLICSVDDRGHLRTLARLSRILAQPGFLPQLRELDDPEAIRNLIAETESAL